MRAWYYDHFVLPLPEGHRAPMGKYRLLRERIQRHGQVDLAIPEPATAEALRRVHTPDYALRASNGGLTRDEVRKIGFPWSPVRTAWTRGAVS